MKTCVLFAAVSGALFAQIPTLGQADIPPTAVVASVEGKDVTLADVRKMIDADPRLMQFMEKDPQSAIAQVFMLKYITTEGERIKIAEQSPLKEQIELLRSQVIFQAMLNQERDTFPVPSDVIDAYYAKNRAKYEEARIKGIYLTFRPAGAKPAGTSADDLAAAARQAFEAANTKGDRTEAQTETLAKEITAKIRAGADFGKMVEQYSDDLASKALGGDLGVIKPTGAFPEALRKAVFALKVGEIAEPVKSGNAFYILRLEGKQMPDLANVREELIQNIRQEHLAAYMNGLEARFKPQVKSAEFFARPRAAIESH